MQRINLWMVKKMNKKERVENFLNCKDVDRVPTAFWHHFVSFHDHYNGNDPEIYKKVVEGQKKYIKELDPDLIKIMSDGFFGHPSVCERKIETIEDLKRIKSVGPDHPWIQKQVDFVKEICDFAGEDIYKYYNLFSPLQYIRLRFEEYDEDFEKFVRLFKESEEDMIKAAKEIAIDIKILVKKLFEETSVDGIYYSVQSVQDKSFDEEKHKKIVEPLDLEVLNEINKINDNVMLHICGYGHYTNNLAWYKDYPAKVFNWATHTENIGLKEGKEIFEGKAVLGGFDNNNGTVLYSASEEELKKEIFKILDEVGTRGVALGADCTISQDIDINRLKLVEKIAEEYK